MVILTVYASGIYVAKDSAYNVSISVDSRHEVYTEKFTSEVTVSFQDASFVNDQLYLSYQVLDADGEVLLEEANRVLLTFEAGATSCTASIEISPQDYGIDGLDTYTVRFDVVDTINLFWFGRSEEHQLYSDYVQYVDAPLKKVWADIQTPFMDTPIIASLNVLAFLGVIAGVIFLKKGSVRHINTKKWSRFLVRPFKKKAAPSESNPVARKTPSSSLSSIVVLRAAACLIVIVAHHVFSFMVGDMHSVFPQLLPRTQMAPRFLNNLLAAVSAEYISFGALGVSIFFLMTGFLTVYGLNQQVGKSFGSFVLQKIVRIYPVYIVGTLFLFVTSHLYTMWAGTTMTYGIYEFLIQMSLFRDWLWIPSVDGLGWTLEVQIKMYLVFFFLHKFKILENPLYLCLIAGVGALFNMATYSYMDIFISIHHNLYVAMYVITFSIVFIIFALFGVVLCQFYQGNWSKRESLAAVVSIAICFHLALNHSVLKGLMTEYSYFFGALLFVILLLLQDRLLSCHGPLMAAISFFSRISFSVYVVHGLSGYYLLSILDAMGVNPYLSLLLTFCATLAVSYLLYLLVERPTAKLASSIGRRDS